MFVGPPTTKKKVIEKYEVFFVALLLRTLLLHLSHVRQIHPSLGKYKQSTLEEGRCSASLMESKVRSV